MIDLRGEDMLRLAICDDDEAVVEQIESYIEEIKEISIVYEVYFSALMYIF